MRGPKPLGLQPRAPQTTPNKVGLLSNKSLVWNIGLADPQSRPRDPSRSLRLVFLCRLLQKSAPETFCRPISGSAMISAVCFCVLAAAVGGPAGGRAAGLHPARLAGKIPAPARGRQKITADGGDPKFGKFSRSIKHCIFPHLCSRRASEIIAVGVRTVM